MMKSYRTTRVGFVLGLVTVAGVVAAGVSGAAETRADRCFRVVDQWLTATANTEDYLQLSLASADPADSTRLTDLSQSWARRAAVLAEQSC
jgi:hypothetical protein